MRSFVFLSAFCLSVATQTRSLAFTTPASSSGLAEKKFCMPNASQQDKVQLFERTLNIGASFSHGCGACEVVSDFSRYLKERNDFGWARRMFLTYHAQNIVGTENKLTWLVSENEVKTNFGKIVPQEFFAQERGYRGEWIFNMEQDEFRLATHSEFQSKLHTPNFNDLNSLVFHGQVRKTAHEVNKKRGGILFQSLPQKDVLTGANIPSLKILDWSMDKTRSFEIFKAYGDEEIFKQLIRSGWQNTELRNELINIFVKRVKETKSTSIMAVDLLFWDTVPEIFYEAANSNLESWPGRLVANRLVAYAVKLGWIEPKMKKRIMTDLMRAFEMIATINEFGPSIPVFIGKLIPNPGETIANLHLQSEYGNLMGSLTKAYLGTDFSQEFRSIFEEDLPSKDENGEWEGDKSETFDPVDSSLPTKIPKFAQRLAASVAKNFIPDFPKIISAADIAFSAQNKFFEEYFKNSNSDVRLLDLEKFFSQAHELVNPHTLHPSVDGAKKMADLLPEVLCSSN